MSLEILEFPRLAQQNGSSVGIVSGIPVKQGSLTAAQTFTPLETLDNSQNVVLDIYAKGAAHTFHFGNASIVYSLPSGARTLIQVPAGTIITCAS